MSAVSGYRATEGHYLLELGEKLSRVQHSKAQQSTAKHSTAQHRTTAQHSTAQHDTTQQSTALHSNTTAQHNTTRYTARLMAFHISCFLLTGLVFQAAGTFIILAQPSSEHLP